MFEKLYFFPQSLLGDMQTEELYKESLNDWNNHDGVVTHLGQTSWSVKSLT